MAITPVLIDATQGLPFKLITIVLILIKNLFDKYLDWRQYKRLCEDRPIPPELKSLDIKDEEYKKSRTYSREKMAFAIFEDLLSMVFEIGLFVVNYWAFLWNVSGVFLTEFGWDASSEYMRAIVFLWGETFRETIWNLPFSYYRHFVVEEKFGFNKQTKFLFFKDQIVSLALKLVFMPLVSLIIIWVINQGGKYFYIYAEITVIIIVIIGMWIYPNFIAPLFNKFEELKDVELRAAVDKLAESVKFPLTKIYVVDGSKRSSHSNAYMYGFGKNKRIVLFDTLINQLKTSQIEAVLCHELGHWKLNHTMKNLVFAFLEIFLMFYIFGFFMTEQSVYASFGFHDMCVFVGLMVFLQIFSPMSYVFNIISLRLIRKFEFQADKFAWDMNRGEELQEGLKKLFKENLSDMDPDPLFSEFNHSHPPLIMRLRYLNSLEAGKSKRVN